MYRNCSHFFKYVLAIALLVILLFSTNSFELMGNPRVSLQGPPDQVLSFSVEGARPLAEAIEILVKKYGWQITYEDARYVHESDLVDKTDPNYLKNNPGTTRRALRPRPGRIDFTYPVTTKNPAGIPDNPGKVIQRLLDAHAAAGNPGIFGLKRDFGIFHVLPIQTKNSAGQMVKVSSILDTRISFPEEERTGYQTLRVICETISKSTGTEVTVGTIPLNFFIRYRSTEGATNEPARNVLVRFLSGTGARFYWLLFYGAGWQGYALNIQAAPDPPKPPQGKMDPTGRRY